jgi:hypothetical protein
MLVTHTADILRHKYLPVFLTDTLGEPMHTLEFRQILTHNPKELPIVFLYSLKDLPLLDVLARYASNSRPA